MAGWSILGKRWPAFSAAAAVTVAVAGCSAKQQPPDDVDRRATPASTDTIVRIPGTDRAYVAAVADGLRRLGESIHGAHVDTTTVSKEETVSETTRVQGDFTLGQVHVTARSSAGTRTTLTSSKDEMLYDIVILHYTDSAAMAPVSLRVEMGQLTAIEGPFSVFQFNQVLHESGIQKTTIKVDEHVVELGLSMEGNKGKLKVEARGMAAIHR